MKLLKYIIVIISFSIMTFAQVSKESLRTNILGTPSHSYLNLNNISSVFKNNGIADIDIEGRNSGFEFPKGSGKTAIFISGLVWGAYVPGDPQVRVGGTTYASGLQPGKIIEPFIVEDPTAEHVRIYRVRPDVYPGGPNVNLSTEAIIEVKSEAEIRTQYEKDWTEWRAIDGAPFEDVDGDGMYNPSVDVPGIPGAVQTIWFVANDLDPSLTTNFIRSQPLGIEYQTTYWEYQNGSFLDNVIFRKYKLINKSSTSFEDMYLSMWSDPDVGRSSDDFAGCDTILNLGYAYNANEYDAVYDLLPPPAVGFKLLQGPTDSSGTHLKMTSFYYLTRGGGTPDPFTPDQFYNYMQGRIGFTGEFFINPITGDTTTYALPGDPLTGEGWIDGYNEGPGDRRMGLSSGPFNMAFGDTQEIVIAEIAALGIDNLDSYKRLKYYSAMTQNVFDAGDYKKLAPKPPNPFVTVEKTNPQIILNWGKDAASVSTVENFNKSGFKFQGYNIYQLPQPLFLEETAFRIETFDVDDGVTEITGIIMNPETGLPVVGIQQHGSDSGIKRKITLVQDYIKDSPLIVGKKYYFAVTAYTYNPDPEAFTNNTESILNLIELKYFEDLPGAAYGDTVSVKHTQGRADANISITIDDPTKITGDDYEIFFTEVAEIRNEDGDWVSASNILRKLNPEDPDTLTGTTIEVAAVNGQDGYSTELQFHLNVVHHYYGWVDGVILTFPSNIKIISSPPFEAGGGTVEPEIIGQELHYGITDNSGTQNGIFHEGGEDWSVFVSDIRADLPVAVDWIAFDDGYAGGGPPEKGTTVVKVVGSASRVAKYWNVFDLTTERIVLEKQSIVNNYYMYPPRDDLQEYFSRVDAPIADGFQTNIDLSYDNPINFFSVTLTENPTGMTNLTSSSSTSTLDIRNYTIFGGVPNSWAITNFGVGTDELSKLHQDYELRFTGVYDNGTIINGRTVYQVVTGGQMATVFRMVSGNALADHPLNPNPGTAEPFLIRIPFELWNVDDPDNPFQVNLSFIDRVRDGSEDPFYAWNPTNRMYSIIVNSPYDSTQLIQVDEGPDQFNAAATWVTVHYGTNYHVGDVVLIKYANPVQFGIDKYRFTTPEPIDSVIFLIPDDYLLFQNYPNPFNPGTTIQFDLPEDGLVTLDVYDILGQRIIQLINAEMPLGRHEVYFNGIIFASGVYIYVLNVQDKFFEAKKMVLLK